MSLGLNQLADRLEGVSRAYADRFGIARDADWFLLKIQEELGELTQAYLAHTGRSRAKDDQARERLADEAADVLCQVLLLRHAMGIDFDNAVQRKWLIYEKREAQP